MREINLIAVHGAATGAGMDIGAEEITRWHTDKPPRGNGWSDIGYHYVIRRDGALEAGRPVAKAGAHIRGHNANSIGVCLVGSGHPRPNYTAPQYIALHGLLTQLIRKHPNARIAGHFELDAGKPHCPGFDVASFIARKER